MTWTGVFPSTSEKWKNLLLLWIGGAAGWITHPGIWLVMPFFRWLAFLAGTAAQESGFNASIAGDDGRSVGMVQFYDTTWTAITDGRALEDREKPWMVGYYAAVYLQTALFSNWRWWLIGLPVVGWFLGRTLWRYGVGKTDVLSTIPEEIAQGRNLPAYLAWRLVFLFPGYFTLRAVLGRSKVRT